MCLEGSDGFVTSTAASIASGWSDPVDRAGLAPAGKTLPYHGALYMIILNEYFIHDFYMQWIILFADVLMMIHCLLGYLLLAMTIVDGEGALKNLEKFWRDY
jgi:hypothetical protein